MAELIPDITRIVISDGFGWFFTIILSCIPYFHYVFQVAGFGKKYV